MLLLLLLLLGEWKYVCVVHHGERDKGRDGETEGEVEIYRDVGIMRDTCVLICCLQK